MSTSTYLTKSPMSSSAFSTPTPSPHTLQKRRLDYGVNDPPPLLKRKRTSPSSYVSAIDGPYMPVTDLPYLNFRGGRTSTSPPLSLPSISLEPRSKRCRIGQFVSSSPQDQDDASVRRRVDSCSIEPDDIRNDAVITSTIDEESTTQMHKSSSSKSMLTKSSSRKSSMNLSRSLSVQFGSLLNLAQAAPIPTDGCPLSASTSSILLPKRKSLLQISASSASAQDIQDLDAPAKGRRSPVTTTMDYLATAMRFPDVAIGLSI